MKVKKLILKALYCLNGDYIPFPQNPLHNTTYENVDVKIGKRTEMLCGETYVIDVISIGEQEPIECELVSSRRDANGTLTIGICQDWG